MKEEFAAMDYKSQSRKVINVHPLTKLRMIYMQVVGILSLEPSVDLSKLVPKGKKQLETLI